MTGKTTIKSVNGSVKEAGIDDLPEIFSIEVVSTESNNTTVADAHIEDEDLRAELHELVNNYAARKTQEIDVKMKIILKDDGPVYQHARRISPNEKVVANVQNSEKYTEFLEERLEGAARDAEPDEDFAPETLENFSKGENLEETPHEALTRPLEEDRRADLCRSRTSLYEDARDANQEQPVSDEKTKELYRDEDKKFIGDIDDRRYNSE